MFADPIVDGRVSVLHRNSQVDRFALIRLEPIGGTFILFNGTFAANFLYQLDNFTQSYVAIYLLIKYFKFIFLLKEIEINMYIMHKKV